MGAARALAAAVTRAGYAATAPAEGAPSPAPVDETGRLRRNLILAALLTLPVFVLEMGGHAYPPFHHWLMAHVDMRAVWVVEMVLFGVARDRMRDRGLAASWGNANWLVLGALVALFLAFFASLCGSFGRYGRRRNY